MDCFRPSLHSSAPALFFFLERNLWAALHKLIAEPAKPVLCLANVDFFRELNNQTRPVGKLTFIVQVFLRLNSMQPGVPQS